MLFPVLRSDTHLTYTAWTAALVSALPLLNDLFYTGFHFLPRAGLDSSQRFPHGLS